MSEQVTATEERIEQADKGGSCGPSCVCHRPEEPSFEQQIQLVLEKVRPFIQMDGGDIELRFRDIRRFGSVNLLEPDGTLEQYLKDKGLGPEPFHVRANY